MLQELSIRNIALIDRLEVTFQRGFNVLTGETGAGKSIVVGSLDFVLGGKADKDRIAGGAESGRVEAVFDISELPAVQAVLSEMGLEVDDGLLPIWREIGQSGRSVCRVAGAMVPLSQLKQITSLLVDLHGQHAHQSLLNPNLHLGFLDAMGNESHRNAVRGIREAYERWHGVKRALSVAESGALERARREDMLRFQVEELDNAALVDGEEEELERQRSVMRNAERIREALEQAYAYVSGGMEDDTPSALDALRAAMEAIGSISRYGESFSQAYEQLSEAVYSLESVSRDLDTLRDEAESDPARLEEIEARFDLLSRLRRKYGATTGEMIAYRERAREELSDSEGADAHIDSLQKEEKVLRSTLEEGAKTLSEARRILAKGCEERILKELSELGMGSAQFKIAFAEGAALTGDGLDTVEFLLSANKGEPLRPLSRVASGGELSRIMLAFKCIEAENEGIPVLVFDEVDTGISGRMGQVVAEKMKRVASARQVLCVTHLPQIAAIADAQYLVAKSEEDNNTRTTVIPLNMAGRAEVLSRMLGGGETALTHAKAMLER